MKSESESAVLDRLCYRITERLGGNHGAGWSWAKLRTWFVESGDNITARAAQWERFYELVRVSLMASDPDIVARFDQIDRTAGESLQSTAAASCA
jgi:hypothetical protein